MQKQRQKDVLIFVRMNPGLTTQEIGTAVFTNLEIKKTKVTLEKKQYQIAFNDLKALTRKKLVWSEKVKGSPARWYAHAQANRDKYGITETICLFLNETPSSVQGITIPLFVGGLCATPDGDSDYARTYLVMRDLEERDIVTSVEGGSSGSVWHLKRMPLEKEYNFLNNLYATYFTLSPFSYVDPSGKTDQIVGRFVRDNPGATNSDVGDLYPKVFPDSPPTSARRRNIWGSHTLRDMEERGIVVKFKRLIRKNQCWGWELTEKGAEIFGRQYKEGDDFLEVAAEKYPKQVRRLVESRNVVRLPGLLGMVFRLWCTNNKHDPDFAIAQIIDKFLSNTEEYRLVEKDIEANHNKSSNKNPPS